MPQIPTREATKQRLRGAGLRATAPRVAVLQQLAAAERPLSHGELLAAIGDDLWDQATVYRNLVKLAAVGLARIASRVGGVARYELVSPVSGPHSHPHFSCNSCRQVVCLPDTQLATRVDSGWQQAILEADLQVVGLCPSCRTGT